MKEKKVDPWKKISSAFCSAFFCRTNIKRDFAIISVAISISIIFILSVDYYLVVDLQKKVPKENVSDYISGEAMASEEEIYQEVKNIQEAIDISGWKNYQSRWYGFEIKYPADAWDNPKSLAATASSKWEYRFQFRKQESNMNTNDSNLYIGFDVVIYSTDKANELSDTEEFPRVKNFELKELGKCEVINGHIIETGDYPAEEIYISSMDDCYNPTLFFSFTSGNYSYNLVPIARDGAMRQGDPRVEITENFPEFFSVASTFIPIEIVRPKPKIESKPLTPKITARMPVSYKIVDGKRVCATKNDKPAKSNKNKKKHLDLECCLDPDEYPNPWCYYNPKKYGRYFK
jgi:hypothetical protein